MRIDARIATLQEISEDLTTLGVELSYKAHKELQQLWGYEVSNLFRYAKDAVDPWIVLGHPDKRGHQIIIEFSCSDLNKPLTNTTNWHGQSTSQWLYAGAIVWNTHDLEWSLHH